MKRRALTALRIVWPAFMAAGLLETLVFAAVDPIDLQGLDRQSAYTIAFLVFWVVISAASAMKAGHTMRSPVNARLFMA